MNALLAHRGPDDSGLRNGRWYALGNRRLSIIDLAGGHQPLCNEDGSVWITLNGEIYDFQALRSELISCGHTFKTNSDTEVIVHGYEQWGRDVVRRLRGQFAFALVHEARALMLVARDHLGINPLHYAAVNRTLVVASEIKSILAYPGVAARPHGDLRVLMRMETCEPERRRR